MGANSSSEDTSNDAVKQEIESLQENKNYDLADVLVLLANINNSSIKIPLFLMVDILNYAGIMPTVKKINETVVHSGNNCDSVYINLILPQSKYIQPIAIHAVVESKDQGWSSYPNEKGKRTSHTWGELTTSTQRNKRISLFRNLHAGKEFEVHDVLIPLQGKELSENATMLKSMLLSECNSSTGRGGSATEGAQTTTTTPTTPSSLQLVLRSQYPQWHIYAQRGSLEVQYELAGDWEGFVREHSQRRGL